MTIENYEKDFSDLEFWGLVPPAKAEEYKTIADAMGLRMEYVKISETLAQLWVADVDLEEFWEKTGDF